MSSAGGSAELRPLCPVCFSRGVQRIGGGDPAAFGFRPGAGGERCAICGAEVAPDAFEFPRPMGAEEGIRKAAGVAAADAALPPDGPLPSEELAILPAGLTPAELAELLAAWEGASAGPVDLDRAWALWQRFELRGAGVTS